MRPAKVLSSIVLCSALLGGCVTGEDFTANDPFLYRDPLVNGPFLVGPHRPTVVVGDCRRLGDIRSQDARLGYKTCPELHPYGGAIDPHNPPQGVVVESDRSMVQAAGDDDDLKAPPYKRAAPSSSDPHAVSRSAW